LKVSVIVLARNEVDGIKINIPKIKQLNVDEIIVIDGNSSDGTFEESQKLGVKVFKQNSIGRGNAFREGLLHATGDILVYFSPDGNEDPQDIPKLVSKIEDGHDLVIASRFHKNSGSEDVTFIRKIANNLTTKVINILFNGNYTDACNGFRAIRKDMMKDLKTDAKWFEIEIQISMRALKKHFRIGEIPTFEYQRMSGISGLHLFSTGLRHGWYILKEFLIR
jgi:glycosyltransferase involved in cell wall biosynthesis